MNTNKMSAMLQANKVSTILAMMGYQVTTSTYREDSVKEIEVIVFYEKFHLDEKDQIIETIIKNMQDGDSYESKETESTAWVTYITTWK